MIFYPTERLVIMIDGVNFFSSQKTLGWRVDYEKLRLHFAAMSELVRPYFFNVTLRDGTDPVRDLTTYLSSNGYTVVTREVAETGLGTMDIELAVMMLTMAENMEHLLLFTSSGALRPAIEAVQHKGVRVTVIGNDMSILLRRQADQVGYLNTFRDVLERAV